MLSEVGMLPAQLMGLNEKKFKQENFEKISKISKNNILSTFIPFFSKIIQKLKFKKIIHQFFPIDTNFFSNK